MIVWQTAVAAMQCHSLAIHFRSYLANYVTLELMKWSLSIQRTSHHKTLTQFALITQ